jgi:hypothetical protein
MITHHSTFVVRVSFRTWAILLDPVFLELFSQGKLKIDCSGYSHFLGAEI